MRCEGSGAKGQVRRDGRRVSCRANVAFTLVEVMVALAIFFMAVFVILGLMSTLLRNARLLQNKKGVDAGLVAAQQLSLTNKLYEETASGDLDDICPGYSWMTDTHEVSTNGLFQVDITVERTGGGVESQMSILRFAPESPPGSLSGGMRP